MRALAVILLSHLLLSANALAQSQELSASGILLDRIVAVVNDGVVLLSELEDQHRVIAARLAEQQTRLPPAGVLREQVLEHLVTQRIQLQMAERLGIRVSDGELNNALTQVAARNGIDFSQLPAALAAQGQDYARYREDMRNEMTIDRLRQREVIARLAITEREIEKFLEQQKGSAGDDTDYDLSHILLAFPSGATPAQIEDVQRTAEDLHARLRNGEDFAQLAVTYSDGQQALDGGRLGWRKGIQLPTLIGASIKQMQPGDITSPTRNAGGYHLFRLNDVRGTERVMVTQYRARHILVRTNAILDDPAARQKLVGIKARVEAGESFADIAVAVSDDPVSAADGGDLGWQSPGTFVGEFEDTLATLEAGQMSGPFRSPFGWHLVLLEGRREHDSTEDIKRNKAIAAIQASKREEQLELWLRRLRDEAYVEKRL